jgi:tetratricopeptide (TPR) repeat protein
MASSSNVALDKRPWGTLAGVSLAAGAVGAGIGLLYAAMVGPSEKDKSLYPSHVTVSLDFRYPNDKNALHELDQARALWQAGHAPEAEALALRAFDACAEACHPETKAKLFVLVGVVRSSGDADPARARDAFEQALKLDPSFALEKELATPKSVAAFEATKDLIAERKQFQAVARRIENAKSEFRAGRFDQAQAVVVQILMASSKTLGPKVRASVLVLFGVIRGDGRRDQVGARRAFDQALNLDPEAVFDSTLATPQTTETFQAAKAARQGREKPTDDGGTSNAGGTSSNQGPNDP